MNTSQLAKYRCHLADWQKARRARSLACDDAARFALHKRVIGRACSSKDFTNAELDKVLAALLAESEPGNLNAQLKQIDQPDNRRASMQARCMAAGAKFITGNDAKHVEIKTVAYLAGIAKRLGYGANWPLPEVGQLAKVMGVIEAQAQRELAKRDAEEEKLAAVPADAADEELAR